MSSCFLRSLCFCPARLFLVGAPFRLAALGGTGGISSLSSSSRSSAAVSSRGTRGKAAAPGGALFLAHSSAKSRLVAYIDWEEPVSWAWAGRWAALQTRYFVVDGQLRVAWVPCPSRISEP